MPIHDWRRVMAGTSHDFHHCWIAELRRSLNRGLLPPGYYAQAEQVATQVVPDVLTLQQPDAPRPPSPGWVETPDRASGDGGLAVAVAPPKVSMQDTASEAMNYAARRSQLVIRHATGHRIVAMLELVSPGNNEKRPAGKPLTAAAYVADAVVTCYVEPLAVGDVLLDIPLFLTPQRYVNVPLEQTYLAAYKDVPAWWKGVLEAAA